AGELATPPSSSGALAGIVRGALLGLESFRDERSRRWRVVERVLPAGELAAADEVLLTSARLGVTGGHVVSGAGLQRSDLPGARGGAAGSPCASRPSGGSAERRSAPAGRDPPDERATIGPVSGRGRRPRKRSLAHRPQPPCIPAVDRGH